MSIIKSDNYYRSQRRIFESVPEAAMNGEHVTPNPFVVSYHRPIMTNELVVEVGTDRSQVEAQMKLAPFTASGFMLEAGMNAMNEFFEANPNASPEAGLQAAWTAMMVSFILSKPCGSTEKFSVTKKPRL